MAKLKLLSSLLLLAVTVEFVAGQVYSVQDIADLQNRVLYDMFDYFHYSQERQLTTVFERLADLESRMAQVERALEIDLNAPRESENAPVLRPTFAYQPDPNRRAQEVPRKRPQATRATAFPRRRPQGRNTPAPPPPPTRPPTRRPTTPPLPTTPPYAETCAEIYKMGLMTEDEPMYSIDPLQDGELINVVCEKLEKDNGRVVIYTVVGHSQMTPTKVSGHEEPGAFSLAPVYEATDAQLKALTRASRSCMQHIEYRCRGAVLMTPAKSGGTYGWWETIDGDRVESWGGAPINSTKCACGVTEDCAGGGSCNCDANSRSYTSDEGDITEKEFLPVKDVRLGDTGGKKETGYIQLGALKCEG